jgi:hypothetical protein
MWGDRIMRIIGIFGIGFGIIRIIGIIGIFGIGRGLLPSSSLFRNYVLDSESGPILHRMRETCNCPKVIRVSIGWLFRLKLGNTAKHYVVHCYIRITSTKIAYCFLDNDGPMSSDSTTTYATESIT